MLGTAAGGGFPQWNCGCANCRGVRAGTIAATPRLQESIAVAARDDRWVLVNTSPDVCHQIARCRALHPRTPRDTPIAAIVLTNGDVDHCLGLVLLREWQPLIVYATERVWRGFHAHNALARTLERFAGQLTWRQLEPGREVALEGHAGPTGLTIEPVAAQGKPPIHLASRLAADPEDNVGVRIRDERDIVLAYFPAVGAVTPTLRRGLEGAGCVFFDGTFWSEDELMRAGLGDHSASDMAHVPVGGRCGSLAALAALTAPHRYFIHLNNTQPLLRADSPERAAIHARGWSVAADGMEITL